MRTLRVVLTAVSLLATLPLGLAAGDSLIGGWTLIEQYYEEGRHNFHGPEDALGVAFHLDGANLAGVVAFEGRSAPWPAYPIPNGFAGIRDAQIRIEPDLRSAVANYRVLPAAGDDTTLVIEERWRLHEDRLLCELKIRFERGGELRGGFTWHRVFRRSS